MAIQGDDGFDENAIYDHFPSGPEHGYGPSEGFNVYRRLNDESLFTDEAREDPVVRAFLDAPFSVTFAQFKSSTRESEWALHKPHLTMTGDVPGIEGRVEGYPGPEAAHIATFILNHDRTMARWKQFVLIMEDGAQAGQMIYKQEETSQEHPDFGR